MYRRRNLIVKIFLFLTIFATLGLNGNNKGLPLDTTMSKRIDSLRYENGLKLQELEKMLQNYELVPKNQ